MHGSFIQQTSHRFDALSAHREQTLYCWYWTTMYGIYTKSTRPVVHTTKSSIINQVQMGFATFSNSICILLPTYTFKLVRKKILCFQLLPTKIAVRKWECGGEGNVNGVI